MYRVGGSTGVFGLSKSRKNVRLSVQHKCHSVRPGWYQMLASRGPFGVVVSVGPQRPGISSRWLG